MLTSLLSFLGGSVFRMLWGELSSYFNKKLDHTHEIEMMKLQSDIDIGTHSRNLEYIRLQSELDIKIVKEQSDSMIAVTETDAWLEAVKGTTKTIGIWFIDAWNGIIRPLVATWAVVMITINFANKGWILDENGWVLCSAALGIYLADRALFKRGK